MKDRIRLELLIAFYYFTNFFSIVKRTKSKNIRADKARVISTLSLQRFIFSDPMFAKIIYEGSGASEITIELLDPPRH